MVMEWVGLAGIEAAAVQFGPVDAIFVDDDDGPDLFDDPRMVTRNEAIIELNSGVDPALAGTANDVDAIVQDMISVGAVWVGDDDPNRAGRRGNQRGGRSKGRR